MSAFRSGKTLLAKSLAKLLDVPLAIADGRGSDSNIQTMNFEKERIRFQQIIERDIRGKPEAHLLLCVSLALSVCIQRRA